MAPLVQAHAAPVGGFWRESLRAVCARLEAPVSGLSGSAAAHRLDRYGPNLLRSRPEPALARRLLSRFRNPLVVLLVAASALAAVTGDVTSCVVITTIVLLSVVLDSVQEHRADRAAEQLRRSVAVRVTALRDGGRVELPVADLVPGDVVLLCAGDLVPADARVLAARDCFVNQALLTGEPYPVEKHAVEEGEPDVELAGASGAVFMGTSVVSGTASVLVCRTGAGTALGEIGAALAAKPPPTAFEIGTRNFGLLILRLAMLMVLFVILVNTVRHRPWLESFLFAVALAVGLTPELLPMIVSVTLSRGALRMATKRVIVKRLAAIHDLGSMNVLCTDKTGTLTEARIRLERHLDPAGRSSQRTLELAYVNSVFESGLKSPLDEAILRHGEIDVRGWEKRDEVPFDFERRRVSVLAAHGRVRLLVVKGALEDILQLSTRYEGDGPHDLRALDAAARQELLGRFEGLGREGYRVLGVAWKPMPPAARRASRTDEVDLVFTGFACFEDPPKASAAVALRALAASGVSVKILTGDNEIVTQHLCAELGLPVAGVLTGAELQRLGDQALGAKVGGTTLFCRVTPPQKNRIILALKRRGHVVGYLGDGINDAPSLHSADVGISVDSGVDVAKEVADLILLERDLGVLHDGVVEGRRTFGNIMKYIMMATSSNFGNMFSMAAASLVLPFLPMLPTQVLLNNLLYDVSEIPIPMDRVDDVYIRRPHRWDMTFIRNFMLAVGPVSSVFDFLTFYVMLHVFRAGEALFHTGWFIESLATQVLVIFVIRTRGSPFRSRSSRLLATTSLAVVATAVLLPFTPLGVGLGFVAPPAAFFLILAAMVVVYLAGVELVKRWFYRRVPVAAA
ncbi:MAG TPA: magnesium-translocating P-type ATPase [Gemmatimonadales bacterium]|nr:magnesium-translocating P-type ATPase [Gemmatimonadales bacterium]